jgi:hypothetical protein
MESKPPSRTVWSQNRGAAVISEGVKIPHSDSSTPSVDKQQPKKPRSTLMQNKTYKDAETGVKMAIIHRRHSELTLG